MRGETLYDRETGEPLDVWPANTPANLAYQSRSNAIFARNRRASSRVGTDGADLCVSQLCASVERSAIKRLPSFGLPVGHVGVVCAQEQMGGIHTTGHVALVTNVHPGRDRTIGVDPREAVSLPDNAFPFEVAVPFRITGSRPKVTARGLRRAVVRQPVRKTRLVRRAAAAQFTSSHDSTPIAVGVRGLLSASNAQRPHNYIAAGGF